MSEARTAFRRRLWERDGGLCHICGNPVDLAKMHLDHVIPRSLGGEDHERNLRASHAACNIGKSNIFGAFRLKRGQSVARLRIVALRLSPALHDRLKALAERERRSLHSQIIYLLEKAMEGEKK